jgi:hypothetical protein
MRGVAVLDFPWSDGSYPRRGEWAESSIAPPPEEGAAGIGARP